ncbi:MAG: ATP phosphoribosyltransferase [Dehalococcoidia bacterium]
MSLKLALPKGWIQGYTAAFLERAGFDYIGYAESSRSYRPQSRAFPELFTKVLHEKDIAIQVASGNYDLAICGSDWTQELVVKYPSDDIVKVRDLGYGQRELYLCTSRFSGLHSVEDVKSMPGPVRIVSEYPNLAEAFVLKLQLPNFRIFPVWGATDVYPPEHADLAIVSAASEEELGAKDLIPIASILSGNAWLIANRNSLERKDLSSLLAPFYKTNPRVKEEEEELTISEIDSEDKFEFSLFPADVVSLALADGHQQSHTVSFLKEAGFKVKGYRSPLPTRRPSPVFEGVNVKVVRPQDMPLQVANGNFDLAVTGRDWLTDQLYRFPSSPVEELLNLGFGQVRIVAVVHNDLPADSTSELRELLQSGEIPVLRIASEYMHIADKYARDNHLSPYKVIPSWGATEAFLPEDADVLIENTETGSTLKKNNLKIIETLFESTGCLIGNSNSLVDPIKKDRIGKLVKVFAKGLTESVPGVSG